MIIDIIMGQMDYLYMKEKYMRYHNQLGAREALKAFDLGECFMPEKKYKFSVSVKSHELSDTTKRRQMQYIPLHSSPNYLKDG